MVPLRASLPHSSLAPMRRAFCNEMCLLAVFVAEFLSCSPKSTSRQALSHDFYFSLATPIKHRGDVLDAFHLKITWSENDSLIGAPRYITPSILIRQSPRGRRDQRRRKCGLPT